MKTPEEIEKLAESKYPTTMVAIFTQRDLVDKNKERRKIFIEGYTECQEDMASELADNKEESSDECNCTYMTFGEHHHKCPQFKKQD